jgi:hypothetical protein
MDLNPDLLMALRRTTLNKILDQERLAILARCPHELTVPRLPHSPRVAPCLGRHGAATSSLLPAQVRGDREPARRGFGQRH